MSVECLSFNREDGKEILVASEGLALSPGGERSSYIRVINRETLQVTHEQKIATRSLNCLDSKSSSSSPALFLLSFF